MSKEQELMDKVLKMIGKQATTMRVTEKGVAVATRGELDTEKLVRKALSL